MEHLLENGSDENPIVALGQKNENGRVLLLQSFERWSVVRSFC